MEVKRRTTADKLLELLEILNVPEFSKRIGIKPNSLRKKVIEKSDFRESDIFLIKKVLSEYKKVIDLALKD